ncbi:MAG: AAA family ATPase [Bacteroidota bacterium]
MQRINNIEIKNFKSIRHQKIDDCKRINVFIGYPNVGKSNILEAIGIFSIAPNIEFTNLIRVKETPTIFFNGFIENPISVVLNNEIGIVAYYQNNEFKVSFREKGEYNEFPDFVLDVEQGNPIVKKWYTYREFKNSAISGFDPSFTLPLKKYEFEKHLNFTNGDYSSLNYPYGENIFSILQTNELLNKQTSELLSKDELELLYDTREQAFTILKKASGKIFTVPYELLADTLQRLIFYKAAILSNRKSVLIFEEPEAQMFPPYIKKLTTDILMDEGENQFFIATHSPYVLGELIEEAEDDLSVYVVDYNKGETIIKRLTDDQVLEVAQYGIDLFFNLESYLDKNG